MHFFFARTYKDGRDFGSLTDLLSCANFDNGPAAHRQSAVKGKHSLVCEYLTASSSKEYIFESSRRGSRRLGLEWYPRYSYLKQKRINCTRLLVPKFKEARAVYFLF